MSNVPPYTGDLVAAILNWLNTVGDPKNLVPEIERLGKAIEDAKAAEAAANERIIQANQAAERAAAAERLANQAQDQLNRDRQQHARDVDAYNAKVSRDTSELTTTRVALEQREAAAKAEDARLTAVRADLDGQAQRLAQAQAEAAKLKARYETALAELAAIVNRATA